jgi:hypothetical protein
MFAATFANAPNASPPNAAGRRKKARNQMADMISPPRREISWLLSPKPHPSHPICSQPCLSPPSSPSRTSPSRESASSSGAFPFLRLALESGDGDGADVSLSSFVLLPSSFVRLISRRSPCHGPGVLCCRVDFNVPQDKKTGEITNPAVRLPHSSSLHHPSVAFVLGVVVHELTRSSSPWPH